MIENLSEVEMKKLIQKMSDSELHASCVSMAEKERRLTLFLLRHLNEIETRHLYSKFGASSLHAYCVKQLKFDDGGAGRRVSAARLLREIPGIEESILSGSVSLTSVAQAGIFFRKEERAGTAFSKTEKQKVLSELVNKSTRETERVLISKSEQPEIHFREKIVVKSALSTEVTLHLDQETMGDLQRLKEIWSHAMPTAKLADVIKRAVADAVVKHDRQKKIERAEARTPAPKSAGSKAEIRRAVWKRDKGICTYSDPQTGVACGSRHFVEEDHVQPKAAGGDYSVENIRLLCRAHNQRHAIDFYGVQKMQPHLTSC